MPKTDGGMKRMGLRSAFLSTVTDFEAEDNAQITTKPHMFYDRVLGKVVIYVFILFSKSLITLSSFSPNTILALLYV